MLNKGKILSGLLIILILFKGKVMSQVDSGSNSYVKKYAFSAQLDFNSITLIYFIPMTQGISIGCNAERKLHSQYYVGVDLITGKTINIFEYNLYTKINSINLYLFKNRLNNKILNQIGVSYTNYENIDYTDYRVFGESYNVYGIILGNNNIHIVKKFPRVKYGIHSIIPVYITGSSNFEFSNYWFANLNQGLPFSFTYISLKFMIW